MKVASFVLSSISILLVLSTLLCGFWLHSHGADPEGVAFHMKLASVTGVFVLISLGLMIALALKVA